MMDREPFLTLAEFRKLRHAEESDAYALLLQILERVHAAAVQYALLGFPGTAAAVVKNATAMFKTREKFLEDNKDVAGKPEFTRAMTAVEEQHPGWKVEDMLKEAARITREGSSKIRTESVIDQVEPDFGSLGERLKEGLGDGDPQ